jgi:CRISPR type IV-associated protein Csf1
MGQHVAWRAPVSMDKNLFRIAIGRDILSINRPRLLRAIEICSSVMPKIAAHQESNDAAKTKKRKNSNVRKHPFILLSRDTEERGHGVLRQDYREIMMSLGMRDEIEFLEDLDEGILWGLASFLKEKEVTPRYVSINDALAERAKKKS